MKQLLSALIILLVLTMTTLPVLSQNQEEIVIWTRYDINDTNNPNANNLRLQIETFQEETGIQVNNEQVAWDQLATKLAIAVQSGGNVPDAVQTSSQYFPALLDTGALLELDDLFAVQAWVDELGAGDKMACIIDSTRYCVAHLVRGGITYYRQADFPSGFPQTTEEWLTVAPQLSSEDTFFSTQYAGRNFVAIELMWYPMIVSNGGAIFDAEGKPAWATPEVAEVVAFGRELFANGYFPTLNITGDFPDAEAPWLDGNAASFRGASWSGIFVPGLKDAVDAGDVAMTGGVDFGGGAASLMVSEAWVIPQGANNPQGASEWIEAFFEPDFLASWAQTQFGIPTSSAAAESDTFDSPFFQAIEQILSEQGVYMQPSPYYLESLDELAIAFQEMLLDPELDPLERLEQAEQTILNRYW